MATDMAAPVGAVEPGQGLTTEAVKPSRYGHSETVSQPDPYESTGQLIAGIPIGARVLDVGCGDGSIARLIRELRQAEVIGVEPSPDRARQAAGHGLTVFPTAFPAPELAECGLFDVVLFADVLEHLVDPVAALRAAAGYLKPGGRVSISMPNVTHWTIRWDLLNGRFDYRATGLMDATHLRWFTRASAFRMVEAAGFTVESYQVSAGTWMDDYRVRRGWRWLGPGRRGRVVRRLAGWWPTLFGCQHVIRARLADRSSAGEPVARA
ncbi:MAG: class I SAM-dependent methyltransferase [Gemmataceae bacterium]